MTHSRPRNCRSQSYVRFSADSGTTPASAAENSVALSPIWFSAIQVSNFDQAGYCKKCIVAVQQAIEPEKLSLLPLLSPDKPPLAPRVPSSGLFLFDRIGRRLKRTGGRRRAEQEPSDVE